MEIIRLNVETDNDLLNSAPQKCCWIGTGTITIESKDCNCSQKSNE